MLSLWERTLPRSDEELPCRLGRGEPGAHAPHRGRSDEGDGAPGKTPFVAAVQLNREGRPVRMRLSRVRTRFVQKCTVRDERQTRVTTRS